MDYLKRIADKQLEMKLDAFGGVLITGPKGCGKTTTAKQKAKSYIEFQDEDERENYLLIANTHPSDLLKGAKPRLFDEWQDAPKIWGAIRKNIDDSGEVGQYILTGSSSKDILTPHTGTLRISRMKMYPMSLYESRDSNGQVSLESLFDSPDSFEGCESDLSIDGIKYVICRGGWPGALRGKTDAVKMSIAKDLFNQTCEVDISRIDDIKRNPIWARTILRSYGRNICTLAETKTILADVTATCDIAKQTYYDYMSGFEKLMIVEDVEAWCPAIRSRTSIRASKKRNFIDPSIGVAAMGLSPEYFSKDYKTLGFLFESLCIRDLKAYSSARGGVVSYYHDRLNLEADAVLHLEDGRYALIEFKLGQTEVEIGAQHLCEIERLIDKHNRDNQQCPLRKPDLKIVITGTKYGYRRDDGVLVIPVGCLKD
ncbi:MAG: ATP-binding protein [Lachnospiraceae bacterium]|nr:ATP-binding protein [Lachnospiraceae bacterium]MBO4669665.1 ATP-binding protein [Lachnospiraceae bacterium]